MNQKTILIVLGVYNGEDYLEAQLRSILSQDHTHWHLLARDDGSSDRSRSILEKFAFRDRRISIFRDTGDNLGVIQNFGILADAAITSHYPYLMFADQDDVWHPEKLSRQLAAMKAAEHRDPGRPVLVHSDLEVVDTGLNRMATSFMKYQGIGHCREKTLNNLLIQNFVTGCTVMVNKSLLKAALPVPDTAVMHDWWFALCAAALGRIEYIATPLVKYRQHRGNQVGAKSFYRSLNPLGMSRWYRLWQEGRTHLYRSLHQARSLLERMDSNNASFYQKEMVSAYAGLMDHTPLKRLKIIHYHRIKPQSFSRLCLAASRLVFLNSLKPPQD